MASRMRSPRSTRRPIALAKVLAAALVLGLPLGGCFSETFQKGYIVPEGALEQIPVGASQEQVLIVLGTPSTVATVSGEAFYYISQRAERPVAFMPQEVIDQRVVAVYFDKGRRVERLANYGIRDGRVFDFVTRTTATAGRELNYLQALFQGMSFKL
jgi:outer membrane protein assembly factor BamE (lipoprotein component of BamABCDE complex)